MIRANCTFVLIVLGILAGCRQDRHLEAEYVVDLGSVRVASLERGYLSHEFKIKNETSSPLKLSDFRKSCACLVVESVERIEPNQTGVVTLGFECRRVPEFRREGLVFRTGNPEKPTVTLELKCFSFPDIIVLPRNSQSIVFNDVVDIEIDGTLNLFTNNVDLLSELIVTNDQALKVEISRNKSIQEFQNGVFRLRYDWRISPNDSFALPAGKNQNFIIEFSVPGFGSDTFSLTLSRKALYETFPQQFFIPRSDVPDILIKIHGHDVLEIFAIKLNETVIVRDQWSVAPAIGEEKQWKLTVSSEAISTLLNESNGGAESYLQIMTSKGELNVPVYVF
jgi:hypothetical protein